MPFTVEDGTGVEDFNSYVTVAYADAYFADRGSTTWTGEDSLKQGALVRATDYVRAFFTPRFDPDKFPEDDLPDALRRAVSEYALIELVTPGSLAPTPKVEDSGLSVVTTKRKVGPLERTFAVAGGSDAKPMLRRPYPVPDALIAQVLLPSYGVYRTTR